MKSCTRHALHLAVLLLLLLLMLVSRKRRAVVVPPRAGRPRGQDGEAGISGDAGALDLGEPLPFEVEWRVPVGCGFSGFFVEVALGFMPALAQTRRFALLCGRCDENFLSERLTPAEAQAFRAVWTDEAARSPAQTRRSVVIEHGDPCGMRRFAPSKRPLWLIARAMTEGDLPQAHAACLSEADEVWVPTHWHVERFEAAGVSRAKLRVVPEPVDVSTFAPSPRPAPSADSSTAASATEPFVFFSNFKWEQRKGWDLLLRAFWAEFDTDADRGRVLLRIKSYLPSWEPGPRDLEEWVDHFAVEQGKRRSSLPRVELLQAEDTSRAALKAMYVSAHAFVLPTRGEGWGLPIAEAMAMGLPVIATNWSGPTAFLRPDNAFALPPTTRLPGGQAEPSLKQLRRAMRRVLEEPSEAARRGARARDDMVRWFAPRRVAGLALARLREVRAEACAARPTHSACVVGVKH